MSEPIKWGGTPGPFEVEEHPFDHDYKTHVVIPSRSGLPGQTVFVAEHNWHEAARGERRISWKEAEYNARAAKELPAMVVLLRLICDPENADEMAIVSTAQAILARLDAEA